MKYKYNKLEEIFKAIENIQTFRDSIETEYLKILKELFSKEQDIVLVGGVAVSYYLEHPRTTDDIEILRSNQKADELKSKVQVAFKSVREHSIMHKATKREIELLTPEFIGNKEIINLALKDYNTYAAGDIEIRIAKPEYLIALKLKRALIETKEGLQDRVDIMSLIQEANPKFEKIIPFISKEQKDLLDSLISKAQR